MDVGGRASSGTSGRGGRAASGTGRRTRPKGVPGFKPMVGGLSNRSRVLKRTGLSRLKDLEPAEPARRSAACSRRRSTLARSSVSHRTPCLPAGVFPDQKTHSALAHLKAALAYYRRLGVTVKRVMTDTVAEPAEAMGRAIPRTPWFGQAHQPSPPPAKSSASNTSEPNPIRPGPMARPNASFRPPCANGPTCLQLAGARAYQTSKQRAHDLPVWTHRYN